METAYRREEIVSSSKASKQLGEVLNEAKRKGRMVVSRNNRLEAVILPIEEYEDIVEDLEHLLTALEIRERKAGDRGKRISWESLKTKYGRSPWGRGWGSTSPGIVRFTSGKRAIGLSTRSSAKDSSFSL